MAYVNFTIHEGLWETHKAFTIVEEEGHSCINGYIYFDKPTEYVHQTLSVSDLFQGFGLGLATIKKGEDLAITQGCETAYLYVEKDKWMRGWYKRLGYIDCEDKDKKYIWMRKNLK